MNRGIYNIGNTCYLNSVIQCITHLNTFNKHVTNPGKFYNSWIKLTNDITDNIKSPLNIKYFIEEFNKSLLNSNMYFESFYQNDACEFITVLFQLLHDSIKEERNMVIEGIPQNNNDKIAIKCLQIWKKHFENDYSYIISNSYSQIYNNTQCPQCNYITSNYDPINIIPLSLQLSDTTIYDCLNTFIKREGLDNSNQWKCDNCNNYVNPIRSSKFWNLSDILIIQLKIYSNNRKLDTNIQYPDILQMDDYNINYNQLSNSYKLYGLCIQSGNLNSGHYISICYNHILDKWFIYNDDSIHEVHHSNVFTNKPYCLFYKRIS